MDLLKKLMGEGVPEWAQPMAPADYKSFQQDVETAIQRLGSSDTPDWEKGTFVASGRPMTFHLQNLVKLWQKDAPEARANRVYNFISQAIHPAFDGDVKVADNLDCLRTRIYDIDFDYSSNLVSQKIGSYLYSALVFDSPTATRSVTQAEFKESGLTLEEMFEIARRSVREQVKPAISKQQGTNGEFIFVMAEFFGASFILELHTLVPAGTKAWVCTPSRDLLLIYIPREFHPEALSHVLRICERASADAAPYYTKPFILEYLDGTFRDLCYRDDEGLVKLIESSDPDNG